MDIFAKNHHEGYDSKLGLEYFFTSPAEDRYPFQWFWDSCFHAIVRSRTEPELAKKELLSLLQLQQPDGFIPHVIFWRDIDMPAWTELEKHPRNSKITSMIQPPMLSIAAEYVYKATGDQQFLAEVLPKITKFHRYILDQRDPDKDHLVSIIQSRESGLDFAPQYDELFGNPESYSEALEASDEIFKKYQSFDWDLLKIFESDVFNVEDLLFNVILVKALEAEARLLSSSGATRGSDSAKKVEKAIIEKMWDAEDKRFYCLAGKDERFLKVSTVSSLLPLWLNLPKDIEQALMKELKDGHAYWREYPVPSESLKEKSYIRGETPWIWRGPTWISTNWMLFHALKEKGHTDLAAKIKSGSEALIKKSGYREYYDPDTGEGYGAQEFGWSTLVQDMD